MSETISCEKRNTVTRNLDNFNKQSQSSKLRTIYTLRSHKQSKMATKTKHCNSVFPHRNNFFKQKFYRTFTELKPAGQAYTRPLINKGTSTKPQTLGEKSYLISS